MGGSTDCLKAIWGSKEASCRGPKKLASGDQIYSASARSVVTTHSDSTLPLQRITFLSWMSSSTFVSNEHFRMRPRTYCCKRRLLITTSIHEIDASSGDSLDSWR